MSDHQQLTRTAKIKSPLVCVNQVCVNLARNFSQKLQKPPNELSLNSALQIVGDWRIQ